MAATSGDPAAFGELYEHYMPRIFAYVRRRTRDRAVSEDITATVFERAFERIRAGTFRNDSLGGWLFRVASNAIVDHSRSRSRLVPLEDPTASGPGVGYDGSRPLPDEIVIATLAAAVDRQDIWRALRQLPVPRQRLIVLRYFDDLSTEEMCAVLDCTQGALAVRMHRALRALRAAMVERGDVG